MRNFFSVQKGRISASPHAEYKEIKRRAEPVDPERLRCGKRGEKCSIRDRNAGKALVSVTEEYEDHRNDERVYENGENSAEDDSDYLSARFYRFPHDASDKVGSDRRRERCKRADEHVVDPERRGDVGEHATDIEPGIASGKKSGRIHSASAGRI